jgi:Ca-activated chloride channel family protein
MLILLLLIPAFFTGYVRLQQRRRRLLAQYSSVGLVQTSASRRPVGMRRHLPPGFFLLALTILVLALARPQTEVSLPRLDGRVLLVFDVSGSMAADDIKPTRLEAAKAAAKAFVERQPESVQVGVISFSDSGFATLPPTNDQAAVVAAINRLTPQKGTSLARGIEAGLNVIQAATNPLKTLADPPSGPTPTPTPVPKGTYISSVIVLLTDGENTQAPDPMAFAQQAADRGVRIYTVGVGSAEGSTLHLDGFTVRSRLDEATLQQISDLTGGTYYNAQSADDLHNVYDNLNPQLHLEPQKIEVTALFAGAGILVLLVGSTLSLLWFGRIP